MPLHLILSVCLDCPSHLCVADHLSQSLQQLLDQVGDGVNHKSNFALACSLHITNLKSLLTLSKVSTFERGVLFLSQFASQVSLPRLPLLGNEAVA